MIQFADIPNCKQYLIKSEDIQYCCLHCSLKDYETGLATFRKAIGAGFRNIRLFKEFLEDEDDGIGTLKGTPEWDEARLMVERIEAEAAKE